MTIVANPSTKRVEFFVTDIKRGKMTITSEILSARCDLDYQSKQGIAVYDTEILQPDGTRSKSTVTLRFDSGTLTMEESEPSINRKARFSYIVDQWVIGN